MTDATIAPTERDVFLIIDVQNGFLPGGSLAVDRGDEVVPLINRIARRFRCVVLTQDWHPADHVSFAANHPGRQPYETIELPYGTQVLWPTHCVQGSESAALAANLDVPHAQLVIRKGYHREIDSYSAFFEADGKTATGLAGYLRERGIARCFLAGLATDFCVACSAIDARGQGFEAFVIDDAARSIDLDGSLAHAWDAMTKAGVQRIVSDSIDATA